MIYLFVQKQHSYTPVLKRLGLNTLIDRRKFLNINFLHKPITGQVDSPYFLFEINFKVPQHSTRPAILNRGYARGTERYVK